MKGTRQTGLAQVGGVALRRVQGGLAVMPMDEFLTACSANGPLQLLVEKRGLAAKRWSAPQPFALIGRDPAADIPLDHSEINDIHSYIQMIDGRVYWVDLGSQAGTRGENGTARSGWLNYPEGIGIGPYVIQVAPGDRADSGSIRQRAILPDPFASRPQDSDDLPQVTLEFRRDSSRPIRWRMRHILTLVGTSPHCKIRLSAPGVSSFHCSLLRTAVGMWVVNLLGSGGVTVNGFSTRASRLEDGDELRIGDVLIRVLSQHPGAAIGEVRSMGGDQMGRTTHLAHPMVASRKLVNSHPEVNWMAPGREAGRLLAERVSSEGELSASLLASVLDQFGQMQQQFLSQFQQTTMMMFRALGTMHRDQMEELREKLDSLHRISENLQAFQAQMPTSVETGSGCSSSEEARDIPVDHEIFGASSRNGTDDCQGRPSVTATDRERVTSAAIDAEQLRARVRSIVEEPNTPSLNVHEWLIGRIAALEDEQRTRWQKILDLVRGR